LKLFNLQGATAPKLPVFGRTHRATPLEQGLRDAAQSTRDLIEELAPDNPYRQTAARLLQEQVDYFEERADAHAAKRPAGLKPRG
jgi:hypothetical protein